MDQSPFFQRTMQFTRLFRKRLNKRLNEIGLYYSQWSIVYFLKHNGPATLVEVSEHLTVEKPTVSRTVKRLEKQQLIEEIPTEDKRERLIQLSDKGLIIYEQAYNIVTDFERSLLEDLDEAEVDIAFHVILQLRDKLL